MTIKNKGVLRTMGMSASQGRFLLLTAQKSNNEYQAQTITFERAMLAENTARWTDEYNDAMMNETLLYGQTDRNSNAFNFTETKRIWAL